MIQPIGQNLSSYKANRISFKNDSKEIVTAKRQDVLEDYFASLAEEKREQTKIIKGLTWGAGFLGAIIAIPAFVKAFNIFRPNSALTNSARKFSDSSADALKSFVSLASDKKVPTLESCKSLSENLRTVLRQQISQLGAAQDIAALAGMPEMTNRLILFGPPGSGKSFFAKVMAKSLDAKYMEVQYSDFNSKWAGEGTQNLKNIFEKILKEAKESPDKKFVVAFNEIDTIIQPVEKIANTNGGTYFMTKLEHRSTFLNYVDEINTKAPNVIIIGTSNLSPKNKGLDGAAMSRFQNIVEVSFPDKKCLLEAMKWNLVGIKEHEKFVSVNDKKLAEIAKDMEARDFSFRDLENMIMTSKKLYLEDLLKDKNKDFSIEYLRKAMDLKSITDGEIARKKKRSSNEVKKWWQFWKRG